MATNPYVTLRPAVEADLPYLNAYNAREGMDQLPGIQDITVAVQEDDIPVGLIRIVGRETGCAYVNPIVVLDTWRGYGVGRCLLEDALETYGELRLISRGSSVGFYQAMGFHEIPWEDIESTDVDDCDNCNWRDECSPLPMGRILEK